MPGFIDGIDFYNEIFTVFHGFNPFPGLGCLLPGLLFLGFLF